MVHFNKIQYCFGSNDILIPISQNIKSKIYEESVRISVYPIFGEYVVLCW